MCSYTAWRVIAAIDIGEATVGKIRPRLWEVVASPWAESDTDINLLAAPANIRIVGDVATVHSSGSDSKESTSTSREINEAMEITRVMDLRVDLRARWKKRRTNARAVNVVVSSEKETYSCRMDFCHKKRENYAGPFAVTTSTPTFPSVSSQNMGHKSSPIAAHSSSPPPLPLVEELTAEDSDKLAPSHHNLSTNELEGIVKNWKALVLDAAKRNICADDSSWSS
ncbi:hypothetical protein PVK06_005657 [Gossypium arboreum]|uniref:Uncharacterized protein n=1 Tax=Gossypium arboreum TaxID=29729 RepID=A0ABR0QVL1_GOSAR|nr:hypothetical protein PVK06_005657 [Gossypium arboreum]